MKKLIEQKWKTFLITLALGVISACADEGRSFEIAVRESVNRQMKSYPESTLKDLYKSFFQDRFGPGHLISDTAAAKNYLLSELNSYSISTTSGEMIEPTGWQHHFYRVDLRVVKEHIISSEVLLNALIKSANEVESITLEEWREEWKKIETIIKAMNLCLPDYHFDSQEIQDNLQKGNYVGHHSEAYSKAYDPHYRIISKKIFEKEILPLL